MTAKTDHDRQIIDQFSRWAAPFAAEPIHADGDGLARTLKACALAADQQVLDVACGPGIVACALAPYAASVTGLDLTPAMIEQARARQSELDLHNVHWQIGSAMALPFGDASFERVVTRYSLHHMTDPLAVVRQMARVCRPGGRMVVIDATPAAACQAAYDAMETLRDPSHTSALTPDQLQGLGTKLGLRQVAQDFYRLEARLDRLAEPKDRVALEALFDADIAKGTDSMDVQPRREADGVYFRFPVSIIAWTR